MNARRPLWKRLADKLITVVPPDLDVCESCREIDCTRARAATCDRRETLTTAMAHPTSPVPSPTTKQEN